jgi:SAM-dependent methyltransferase
MDHFYSDLARWWPLVSPVEDYAEEAAEFIRVFREAGAPIETMLELGAGGGHNAFYLKRHFKLTLSDLSDDMLAVSQRLNPECEHRQGDMRTLDLGRELDAVFVHDAVDYMITEADLALAMATAHRHCKPGGVVLFVPDAFRESFEPSTDCGGSDAPDGSGVRYLEWSYADAGATVGTTQYTFLTREVDGTVRSTTEAHPFGLYPRATWLRLLEAQGFAVEVVTERTTEDREPRSMLLCRRQASKR